MSLLSHWSRVTRLLGHVTHTWLSRGLPGSGSGSGGDLQPITAQYHSEDQSEASIMVRTNQRPVLLPVSAEVVVATVVGELAHSGGHLQPGQEVTTNAGHITMVH